ncbi:putative sulfate exporter family transporter [soil metagenome]
MTDVLRDAPGSLVPGLALVAVGTAIAAVIGGAVGPVSTLVCAVVIGAIIGNLGLAPPVMVPGLEFAAKTLLRAGVVLLGLRLSLGDVGELGVPSLAVVAVTVTATFFGTQWLGRRLGLSRDLSLLVATGFSICGASAIAAVESSTEAEEEEVAAAIGLVTLFGSLAILVLPLLQGLLGLTEVGFGTWVGASVHDVGQVVATASAGGSAVVAVAVVVKLTRVILLAPIVAGVNLHRRKDMQSAGGTRPPVLPLFVVGFLAMIALRTTGVLPAEVITVVKSIEGWLLAAALVGLGSNVRVDKLRRLGPKPLVLGALAWGLVAVASYGGVLMTQ